MSSSRACTNFIHAVSSHQIGFSNQLATNLAVIFVPDRRDKKQARKLVERNMNKPGYESVLGGGVTNSLLAEYVELKISINIQTPHIEAVHDEFGRLLDAV